MKYVINGPVKQNFNQVSALFNFFVFIDAFWILDIYFTCCLINKFHVKD
jgi:hypothetical protein